MGKAPLGLLGSGYSNSFPWSASHFSCSRMYLRTCSSSRPTVLTQYPTAQKCRLFRFWVPSSVVLRQGDSFFQDAEPGEGSLTVPAETSDSGGEISDSLESEGADQGVPHSG